MIPSPSPSVKIQIMGGKVGLRCKSKTLLDVVNKLFTLESLLTKPSTKPGNVLSEKLKQKFMCSWLLEGDGIESRLPFKIFFTLAMRIKFQGVNKKRLNSQYQRHALILLKKILNNCLVENYVRNVVNGIFSKQENTPPDIVDLRIKQGFPDLYVLW